MGDRILVRDLRMDCIVGIEEHERVTRQRVLVNLALECDLAPSAASDRIEDTINYVTIKNDILALAEASRFFLIEKLADRIAALCLAHRYVRAVTVTVDKPGALTGARSVAVELRREKPGAG